ncbi:MAG: dolichyl-phosphate-mannose-protein mannosyltransferase, partial [Actinomycetota bacterium]|nr:dolichyl-phosphate-mannose-protein mannosyltransferase [Actinomycetota bacterium]
MTATLDATASASVEQQTPSWRSRMVPLVGGGGWLPTLAITLLAGLLRFIRLDIPRGKIFDEIYYSCDAQNLLRFGVE